MGSLFWFISTIVFIVIEFISVSLVSIWFVLSSFVMLILSYFISNTFLEILLFSLFSVIFFILTKPIYNKYFKKRIEKTNIYSIIGKTYILNEEIKKNKMGKIKINDQLWNVISKSGDIESGEEVIIDEIDGTKLIVRKSD